MVSFNISVDDSSPLITYSGAWLDTHASDTLAANYSVATLHLSNILGATASFKFNGTGIWLYGGHIQGHGNYTLSVDGNVVTEDSTLTSPDFDQLLGGRSNMLMGEHTAVLTNVGGESLGLDSLVFETQIGGNGYVVFEASEGGLSELESSQQVSVLTIDDNNRDISYFPPAPAWNVASHDYFDNGTAHFTETGGAQASLSFSGNAIAVYGGVSFDHGNYTVTLDGDSYDLYGGAARSYHPQSLLYFANGLGSEEHNLTITANEKFFDLDSIKVYTAVDSKTGSDASSDASGADISSGTKEISGNNGIPHVDQASHTDADANKPTATTKSISKSVLTGIISASVIGFITLLLLVLFIVMQVRKRRRRRRAETSKRLMSPVLPIQNPDLELGGGDFLAEKNQPNLQRNDSKTTSKSGKSAMSRWSQESFVSGPIPHHDTESLPPVPTRPLVIPTGPRSGTPVPRLYERDSVASSETGSHKSSLVEGDDGRGTAVDDYYYRNSTVSSIAPLRPSRPPTLDLGDLGTEFDHVPLSS